MPSFALTTKGSTDPLDKFRIHLCSFVEKQPCFFNCLYEKDKCLQWTVHPKLNKASVYSHSQWNYVRHRHLLQTWRSLFSSSLVLFEENNYVVHTFKVSRQEDSYSSQKTCSASLWSLTLSCMQSPPKVLVNMQNHPLQLAYKSYNIYYFPCCKFILF